MGLSLHPDIVQVLTNEEWYEIMWNLMDSEFRYSCAYFMAIIVIGDYLSPHKWKQLQISAMRLGLHIVIIHTSCVSNPLFMFAGTYFFWNVWLNAMLAIFIRRNKQDAVSTQKFL